ncbi:hypothetical protein V1291_005354 [Nitrobacteraceae bacterium AZCC 1564]
MKTSATSACSCRLGGVMRALKLGAQPRPGKRRFQIIAALFLFLASCFLFTAIIEDDPQLEFISLVAIGCLAAVTFAMSVLSGIVGVFGCDDCVSRL